MLVKVEVGALLEKNIFRDAKDKGVSVDETVNEIIKKHYEREIYLSSKVTYDFMGSVLFVNQREIVNLTIKENKVLFLLVNNRGNVVETKQIYKDAWNVADKDVKDDFMFTLRNMINKLRTKLGSTVNIRNKSGHGYMLDNL